MRRQLLKGLAACVLSVASIAGFAQDWPARPVKVIVPFPPGSATDVIARLVASELQRSFSQPFVVDNRPGAQGTIAADALIRSDPDGYTLMMATSALASTSAMVKSVPFDTARDFTPISRLVYTSLAVLVHKDFPVGTPAQFLQHVKAQQGNLKAGYGSPAARIALSQLRTLGDVEFIEVPYQGIPRAITDLLGGTLDITVADLTNAMAQAKSGNVKVIGLTAGERSPLVPDWPSMAEVIPGYNVDAWIGLMGPRGLPLPIAQRLHDAASKAIATQDVGTRLSAMGMTPAPMGPVEMRDFFSKEIETRSRQAKQAGIEPQ